MGFQQLVSFDLSKMGMEKMFSLRNARLGFGIPARHATAHQAMQENIEKRSLYPLSTIPKNCSVPIFETDKSNSPYGNVIVFHEGKFYQDGKALKRKPGGTYMWGEYLNGVHILKRKGGER